MGILYLEHLAKGRSKAFITTLLLGLVILAAPGYCLDVVRIQGGTSDMDQRLIYPIRVLTKALEATQDTDGQFKVETIHQSMGRRRSLEELQSGELINVSIAATRQEWEEKAIPIRIPLLKGLLGYRLFLVRQADLEKFSKIQDLKSLKALRAGSGSQWTSTAALDTAGFTLVTGIDYEGLFSMLDYGRFDYFPRGVNEIFLEFRQRKVSFPNLCIEPSLALYCPLPSYFFVSPRHPELADRICRGMEIISANGVLNELFLERYGPDIKRAGLKDRTIFRIANPLLSTETPLNNPDLWFTP